ncbi:MAG TPA: FtsQ-type POTRA domain-containing protein [Nitrospirota bacterium]|nr:FtsQ-type POTRA domain-containing protein [Nitrospirota bacterium]
MRDYKNVKVPKSYRGEAKRTTVKRVVADRAAWPRKRAAGLTNILLKVMIVLLIAAGGVLAWQVYRVVIHADLFVISGVDIKGVKMLSDRDLKDIVGVFTGQNIFRVDLSAAVKRTEGNPWVKEARIYRRLPNRITMVFTERTPTFLLDTGTARYLMDGQGVVIERLAKEQASVWPLPVIAIRDYRAHPGEEVTAEGLPGAIELIAEISARGGWQLPDVTVKADSPEMISVLYGGCQFKIGSGRYGEKLRRLAEVMADVNQRGVDIAYVDLRPERQAAVMVEKMQSKAQSSEHKVKRR